MRRSVWYLTGILVLILGAFAATMAFGHRPVLGLDLQGGVSVTLNPARGTRTDALDKAVQIIRNRVDGLGVAEPEISRQGRTIVVDLPGVKDRAKAQRIIGRTAELLFRPVLTCLAAPARSAAVTPAQQGADIPTTDPTTAKPTETIVADGTKGSPCAPGFPRYQLGPAALRGKGVSSAQAQFQSGQGWAVVLNLTSDGSAAFNRLAGESFPKPAPQNRVAIALDTVVQSAPTFQTSTFEGGHVQITGNFSRGSADDLALVLRYGALPVKFDRNSQQIQSVSPTLGRDQLRAGLAAGAIGLAVVALYVLAFYRVLGFVIWFGVALSGAAIFAIVSYLGHAIGLTLTLAGVTGIIVSVGVTVDSYVVYFERLKDVVRGGRTVRSSVDHGFSLAWRTILAADLVSLFGATVLYFLAIGSVRGFAFYLGLSTLLDLFVAYFFMHPLVSLMARRSSLVRARFIGMASGLDVREATA